MPKETVPKSGGASSVGGRAPTPKKGSASAPAAAAGGAGAPPAGGRAMEPIRWHTQYRKVTYTNVPFEFTEEDYVATLDADGKHAWGLLSQNEKEARWDELVSEFPFDPEDADANWGGNEEESTEYVEGGAKKWDSDPWTQAGVRAALQGEAWNRKLPGM